MKIEEVIKKLEGLRLHCQEYATDREIDGEYDTVWHEDVQALDEATEVLEKEIPKISGCRICDDTSNSRYFKNNGYEYCPYCGQKLSWEVQE